MVRVALILLVLLAPATALAAPRDELNVAVAAKDAHDLPRARALLEGLAKTRDTPEAREVAARASFLLGELDELERPYDRALARYREVLAIDPGNWFAGTARARIEVLSVYEGSFAELAALDAIRKDPARVSDPAAIEALERDAPQLRHARVRTEALLFVAEAYAGRLRQPARSVTPALIVARSEGAEPAMRLAAWDLADVALREVGDLDRARTEILDDPRAPTGVKARVVRALRRRGLHRASLASMACALGLGVVALASAARRGRLHVVRAMLLRRSAIAFLIVTPVFGGVIAETWERGMGAPFTSLGITLLLVHLLVSALRGGFGDRPRRARIAAALAAAACVLASAYLVLERGEAYGRPLLEGFGL